MRIRTAYTALLLAIAGVLPQIASSQATPGVRAAATGEIRGRLADSASGRALAGGSITARRAGDSTFAGGTLPRPDGSFRVDGLVPGKYTLRIRVIGFRQVIKPDIVISAASPMVDLGTVTLSNVVTKLDEQVVVAEREDAVLSPDRNSYSTKNMTTASGGTAVDVLRNIPSVEVDGSNKVSLRSNENVVVQINGRSSPLKGEQLGAFLAQLPAGLVKTVEVATNPSAKNDPEGTAGIINIVLNQDTELGLSGGVTAGTATTGQMNLSGNVGKQTGPLTLFLSGSVYHDKRVTTGTTSRTNLLVPVPAFTEASIGGTQHPFSGGGTLRSEYRLSESDALSFDGFFYGGRYGGETANSYTDLDGSRAVIGLFDQYNAQKSKNFSQDYSFAFRRQGKPNTTQFSGEVEYSNNYNNNSVDLSGLVIQSDPSILPIPTEHDYTIGHYPTWNLKADYTKPFSATSKLEAGFKGIDRGTTNDFMPSILDASTGVYVDNAARATNFDYHEDIGAGYAVYSQQLSKVQAQAGLRLEEAHTKFELPMDGLSFDNRYASAFPSAILSYNLSDLRQVKFSYSRRVSRPYPQQLSPVEFRQDTRNVFRGNPNLKPEYTDAMELGFQDARSWGSIQLNPYLRHTSHAVRNIQFVDSTGVSVSTFDNVASTLTMGSDLNVSVRHGPLTFFGGGTAYHYSSDASNLSGNLSAHTIVWSARANGTWKFTPLLDLQIFGSYRAPFATEGGTQFSQVLINAATRYKIWGDQGNISLRVSDPFNLMKFGYRTENGTVIESAQRYPGMRAIYLTVTRNFGQAVKLRPKQPEGDQSGGGAPTSP
jgi:outer membrane receptor protein involved in Fe transport